MIDIFGIQVEEKVAIALLGAIIGAATSLFAILFSEFLRGLKEFFLRRHSDRVEIDLLVLEVRLLLYRGSELDRKDLFESYVGLRRALTPSARVRFRGAVLELDAAFRECLFKKEQGQDDSPYDRFCDERFEAIKL